MKHILALFDAEQRKELEQKHENGNGKRHSKPCLWGIAHTGGDGLPADHNGKHADIGADAGKGAHLFTGLLLHR